MSPSLTGLINDVYTLTNRPDLVSETVLAVRAATLKAHNSDYYYKDLFQSGLEFGFSATQQTVQYKTIVPRWKSLSYLRKYDPSTTPGTPLDLLTVITPQGVLDNYSINKEDVCYVAGQELIIRTRVAQQYFLLGCYVYPDVTIDGYDSWIATDHPFAIIYDATATVFKTIGYDEQNAAYQRMVADEYQLLKQNNILANGY